MSNGRVFAGPIVRRLRRAAGLTQAAMASALDISPSYLNLIEHGQRPLSAALIVRLAERFGFDPATLGEDRGAGGVAALRRRLADPLFADLGIDGQDAEEWMGSAPELVAAFAKLYDAKLAGGAGTAGARPSEAEAEPVRIVRHEIERWSNHFADLDAQAEVLADELRLANPDLYSAIAERLRSRHQIAIRILPTDVMPDRLRRLDLHARQLQLSEWLGAPSRTFQAAVLLAQLEAKSEIDALVAGAALTDRAASLSGLSHLQASAASLSGLSHAHPRRPADGEGQLETRAAKRLFRRHLAHYYAAALIMPYDRFLRACEGSGYDLPLLERRFGVSFEQLAHRLTTMSRVGARGLPFFMLRVDRAGQVSKRYAGASGSPMVDGAVRCARWRAHEAFERPTDLVRDVAELEDGSRWMCLARSAASPVRDVGGHEARFAVVLGVEQRFASPMSAASVQPERGDSATSIGLGCARCLRADCAQRGQPPHGKSLTINERERGLSAFSF
ncbi:MAG: short-chain fatty acyl-CoA regulator family protein [Sphingopyxis sp.]